MHMPTTVESVGGSEGQSESQLAVTERAPAGAYILFQVSGGATQAEKQKS